MFFNEVLIHRQGGESIYYPIDQVLSMVESRMIEFRWDLVNGGFSLGFTTDKENAASLEKVCEWLQAQADADYYAITETIKAKRAEVTP